MFNKYRLNLLFSITSINDEKKGIYLIIFISVFFQLGFKKKKVNENYYLSGFDLKYVLVWAVGHLSCKLQLLVNQTLACTEDTK